MDHDEDMDLVGGTEAQVESLLGAGEITQAARTATPVEAHPRSKRVRRAKSCGTRSVHKGDGQGGGKGKSKKVR